MQSAPEQDSANNWANNIFLRVWFACKLLYDYIQFILCNHLIFMLYNGGGEGEFGKSGSCLKKKQKKKHVDMWCMQTAQHKALCIGADASGRNVLTPEVVI